MLITQTNQQLEATAYEYLAVNMLKPRSRTSRSVRVVCASLFTSKWVKIWATTTMDIHQYGVWWPQ